MTSMPTVSKRVICCSVSVTSSRNLASDEPGRIEFLLCDKREQLRVVRLRVAERAHNLPLFVDKDVDRDGDHSTFLLRGEPYLDMAAALAKKALERPRLSL